ncbi:uncharacterized protein LOC126904718 [Daktulosphaira vitifoliae]|uniref:uncharacterized protein LOC126904718 n=1 Tax=Daktulosphaira vitifoliae TaxID=58002 RepID=UPI0021A9873B|nr:uncharacterized protein LOC126904718 [Daktulosphaira vitifoliae]
MLKPCNHFICHSCSVKNRMNRLDCPTCKKKIYEYIGMDLSEVKLPQYYHFWDLCSLIDENKEPEICESMCFELLLKPVRELREVVLQLMSLRQSLRENSISDEILLLTYCYLVPGQEPDKDLVNEFKTLRNIDDFRFKIQDIHRHVFKFKI